MAGSYSIPFYCSEGIRISHRARPAIHMRMMGGEPVEKLLLYPDGVSFGMQADSVIDSVDIQTGLALYGDTFNMGMQVRASEIQLGSGKTLTYTDPMILGELDEMTLDGIPFE